MEQRQAPMDITVLIALTDHTAATARTVHTARTVLTEAIVVTDRMEAIARTAAMLMQVIAVIAPALVPAHVEPAACSLPPISMELLIHLPPAACDIIV